MTTTSAWKGNIIGLAPLQFVHILDNNTNVSRLEVGPKTLVLQTNEQMASKVVAMVTIPPGHFCFVRDPMSSYKAGVYCKLRLGETKVCFHGEPFPLYPGESVEGAVDYLQTGAGLAAAVRPLPVVKADHAIRLQARVDHKDGKVLRKAGDMWQLRGPLTYYPSPYVQMCGMIKPEIIKYGSCLTIMATQDFVDSQGRNRVTGEEWIISQPGAYLPDVYEKVLGTHSRMTLTPETGLHLRADTTLTDFQGKNRVAGEEWLLTGQTATEYFPEIGVEVVKKVQKTVLQKHQFCVVVEPLDPSTGKPSFGKQELRVGLAEFFLHPGEKLQKGIQDAVMLEENESLVLQATDRFVDSSGPKKVMRRCGDRWLISGPLMYIPPIPVLILKKRQRVPLSKNEGIYVQDMQTGKVRAIFGPCSYELTAHEELWNMELPPLVEELLKQGGGLGGQHIRKVAYYDQSIDPKNTRPRVKHEVVTYRCPGNTAVQVNNHQDKTARVVFGPDLVILSPHESFNVLSLSAGKPKVENALKSLCLFLGPDFITDILEVETSDHARLRIQLAFNVHFEYTLGNAASEAKLFSVPDFIGFACRQIGSRIRAMIAQIPFDEFHHHSNAIIHSAVFGKNPLTGALNPILRFDANNLVVSNISVESIEPADAKMRDSLTKSVQLAIEISTKSIETAAAHEAQRNEQKARAQLERQKLENEKEVERARAVLLELQAASAAVESTGQATAEARALAERTLIEGQSMIEVAQLQAKANEIEHSCRLECQARLQREEISYMHKMNELELFRRREEVKIQVEKFASMVSTLGKQTVMALTQTGPENRMALLEKLGLDCALFKDGNKTTDLFNFAESLLGGSQLALM